jgi:hypothetical protein
LKNSLPEFTKTRLDTDVFLKFRMKYESEFENQKILLNTNVAQKLHNEIGEEKFRALQNAIQTRPGGKSLVNIVPTTGNQSSTINTSSGYKLPTFVDSTTNFNQLNNPGNQMYNPSNQYSGNSTGTQGNPPLNNPGNQMYSPLQYSGNSTGTQGNPSLNNTGNQFSGNSTGTQGNPSLNNTGNQFSGIITGTQGNPSLNNPSNQFTGNSTGTQLNVLGNNPSNQFSGNSTGTQGNPSLNNPGNQTNISGNNLNQNTILGYNPLQFSGNSTGTQGNPPLNNPGNQFSGNSTGTQLNVLGNNPSSQLNVSGNTSNRINTSGQVNITPSIKLEFSSEETTTYQRYFSEANVSRSGKIDFSESRDFFPRTNVPKDVLSKIWDLVSEGQNFLNQDQFCKALKLIAFYQTNPTEPLTNVATYKKGNLIPQVQTLEVYNYNRLMQNQQNPQYNPQNPNQYYPQGQYNPQYNPQYPHGQYNPQYNPQNPNQYYPQGQYNPQNPNQYQYNPQQNQYYPQQQFNSQVQYNPTSPLQNSTGGPQHGLNQNNDKK